MAVDSTVRRVVFKGDGVGASFPFAFKVFEASDVGVVIDGADIAYGVDFSVALNADQENNPGGVVVLKSALPVESVLAIVSSVPMTQPMVLTPFDGFNPTTLNESADRGVIISQQIAEKLSRAITTDATDTITPQELKNRLLNIAENALSIANEKAAEAGRYASSAKESATFAANTVKDLPAQTAASVEEVKRAASSEGAKQVGLVTASGDSKLSEISSAGQEQLDKIATEGAAQKSIVTSEGSSQIGAINSTGAAQLSSIEYEGDRQVARVRAVVDNEFVAQGTGCSQAAWELQNAIASGTEIPIPSGIQYLVGRNHLRVAWNGLSLFKGRNWDEVGEDDTFSSTIKLLFDANKGDEIEVWVGALGNGDVANAVTIARSAVQLVESLEQKVVYQDEEAAS